MDGFGKAIQKKEKSMKREQNIKGAIPIQFEDTNLEVLARIVKAASRKYDCSVNINFSDVFVTYCNSMLRHYIRRISI